MVTFPDILPICAIIPDFLNGLAHSDYALVTSETGSGKTTYLPLALLDCPALHGQKIWLLEPRRLAVKMAAWRMADILGEEVGQTVGFSVRGERVVSSATRIEVMTQALLTRRIQNDPTLSGVGIILFDEFHERALEADLALTLAWDAKRALELPFKMVLMSATLDSERLQAFWPEAQRFHAVGRHYAVSHVYMGHSPHSGEGLYRAVCVAIARAFRETSMDILVFLPGMREIRAVDARLGEWENVRVMKLHSALTRAEQHNAVSPQHGIRKIILSSAIAESSLTIEGIGAVVDSTLERCDVYDVGMGMNRRVTRRAALSRLEQRAGRAGRLSHGVCYRLMARDALSALPTQSLPEILTHDLTSLYLEIATWGAAQNVYALPWLDPPPEHPLHEAQQQLQELNAIDSSLRSTPLGAKMVLQPLSVRLAHMLLTAGSDAQMRTACRLCALLTEPDLKTSAIHLSEQFDTLSSRARELEKELIRQHRLEGVSPHYSYAQNLLMGAFRDRLAQRRKGSSRYLMVNGQGLYMDQPWLNQDQGEDYIIVVRYVLEPHESRITLAFPVTLDDYLRHHSVIIETKCYWDETLERVKCVQNEKIGALVIREKPVSNPSRHARHTILNEQLKRQGLAALNLTESVRNKCLRSTFLHHCNEPFPDLSESVLINHFLAHSDALWGDVDRLSAVKPETLHQVLDQIIGYEHLPSLQTLAPEMCTVPSGSKVKIRYDNLALGPYIAIRLQEVFGWTQSPKLVRGSVPLTLQLLSPAMRPVQTTRDLHSFWTDGYFYVRKTLRGQYPKHYWPENPLDAQAIQGSLKRRKRPLSP